MVMTSASCTDAIGVTHERRGRPFRCTVHAPHWATPQPYFVPVSLTSSRNTHSKGVSGSTSTLTFLPLTEKFVTGAPKESRDGKHCGDGDFYSARPCAAIARLENREHGQLRLKREGWRREATLQYGARFPFSTGTGIGKLGLVLVRLI